MTLDVTCKSPFRYSTVLTWRGQLFDHVSATQFSQHKISPKYLDRSFPLSQASASPPRTSEISVLNFGAPWTGALYQIATKFGGIGSVASGAWARDAGTLLGRIICGAHMSIGVGPITYPFGGTRAIQMWTRNDVRSAFVGPGFIELGKFWVGILCIYLFLACLSPLSLLDSHWSRE